MIYEIKIEQSALLYIKHVLPQRPFSEVSAVLASIENQQVAQDAASAIPIDQLNFGSGNANIQHSR
jgi:hypothetical protein